MRRSRTDEASTHVLEAVIIATIMVSSVAYVATFQAVTPAADTTRASLQQRATDALNILSDTPMPGSALGDTELSTYIAQCLQNDCANLTHKLDLLLPEGTSYSLSLSNGYDTFPVYNPRQPAGEATTASHLIEPKWSYTFLATGQAVLDPTKDPMTVYALPIFDSNLLDQGGSPLRVLVHGVRQSDNSNFTVSATYTTAAQTAHDALLYPAAALTFLDNAGLPVGAMDVSATTSSGGNPTLANVPFKLRLTESAGVAVPAGTELKLSMPRSWNASASSALNPGWTFTQASATSAGDYTASDIIARTVAPLTSGSLDLKFNATFHGDLVQDYDFHAALSKGALAEANLLVRGVSKTTDPFAVPMVVASVPRPMGALKTTTWTLGVSIPPMTVPGVLGQNKAENITIESIDILEQDARQIFGATVKLSGPGEIVSSGGDRLVWNGSVASTSGLLSIAFNVTGSGVASPTPARSAFAPPTTTADSNGRLLEQVASGFYRGAVLPSGTYGGYDTSVTSGDVQGTHVLHSDGVYRGLTLPGTVDYTVGGVSSISGSPYGSYVGVQRRNVEAGGTAVIDVDVQSLLFTLSAAGQKAGVRLNIYPPWSGAERVPIQTTTSFDTQLLSSDVTAMTLLDVNGDGYADPILGTSNGRVLALHALTGGRIEGDVFVAPVSRVTAGSTAPGISELTVLQLGSTSYVVVGTDQGSVFVLDKNLQPVWDWYQGSSSSTVVASVVSMESASDVDGDGLHDVVVGIQLRDSATSSTSNLVYVLRALAGATSLQPLAPSAPGTNSPFYQPLGTPTAVLGLPSIGPNGTQGGVATTFQYTLGVSGMQDPVHQGHTTQLPRAGLRGVAANGNETWTFFGSPVTTARAFDYDGDAITDIVGGSPAGYVFMMNGTTPTQPLYSKLITPALETLASSTHDGFHSAIITADGSLYFTTDGWITTACAGCDPTTGSPYFLWPTARAIALNASSSMWVAGLGGEMWRSVPATSSATASAVQMVNATPLITKDGSAFDPKAALTTYDFTDLSFRWGAARDQGWALANPRLCVPALGPCSESLLMRTTDGGVTWNVLDHANGGLVDKTGGTVRVPLHHINFTTSTLGWIAGDNGTLLRTVDGGATWAGIDVGTQVNLTGAACAPELTSTCIVVGEGGNAWRTKDSGAHWTSLGLSSTVTSRTLLSIGMANQTVAYIGTTNMVLKTWDGGDHWSALPMNYIQANGDRVDVLPDGTGYIYGGNSAHQRSFFLGDYAMTSRAQTVNLATSIPTNALITGIDLEVSTSEIAPNASVSFSATPDGGAHWYPLWTNASVWTTAGPVMCPPDVDTSQLPASCWDGVSQTNDTSLMYPKDDAHDEYGSLVYDHVKGYTRDWVTGRGTDLRLRMDFDTTGDYTLHTPSVHGGLVNITYVLGGVKGVVHVPLDATSTAQMDPAATTAAWLPGQRSIQQPIVREYWTRNVSGAVEDVLVGASVSGDARGEVWVSTGTVIAENSPDSIIYAGAEANKTMYPDDRIYLLDGANGTIIANTTSFWGPVTHIALSDVNGTGHPDHLFATVWDGVNATLVCLDPATLTVQWSQNVTTTEPSALIGGAISGPKAVAILADRTSPSGPSVIAGRTLAYRATDGTLAWGAIPDDEGRYTVNVPIPRSWLFGPYVVEVGVDWNATVSGAGVPTPRDVVQSMRLYDSFLVTPPGALSPPSPVYNVQLTTWYDDWR